MNSSDELGKITVKINDKYENNKDIYYMFGPLISVLTHKISKNTPIEYWVNDRDDRHVSFTIKTYSNDDKNKPYKDVIKEKTNIITTFLSTMDTKMFNNNELWLLRYVMLKTKQLKIPFNNLLQVVVSQGENIIINKVLDFQVKGLQPVKYVITRLCDGSTIRQFIDPYINEYGIFCDYSKTFDEYDYIYNGLHIYEHYIANCWNDMDEKNVIMFNGGTYNNGLMYIYSVVSDYQTLKERFTRYVEFHIKSSDTTFIKQTKLLERETLRTISEGYKLRNLTRMARTPQRGFNMNYSTDVFAYWSSQPMNILLITNKEININVDFINKFYKKYHKNVKQPQKQQFDYFPREVFHVMSLDNKHIYKKSTDKIVKKIYGGGFKSLYGIDTRCVAYKTDNKEVKQQKYNLSYNHTLIHSLLIYAKFVSDNFIKNYVMKTPFPNNVHDFESQPIHENLTNLTIC